MNDNEKNLELWNAVCVTDEKNTKQVSYGKPGKPPRKFTAINAISQVKKATEQWGMMGKDWYVEHEIICCTDTDLIILVKIYAPGCEHAVIGYGCESVDAAYGHAKNESHKKAYTDGLTKALSWFGFNADVFEGKFDSKYDDKNDKNKPASKPQTSEQQKDDPGEPPICPKHNRRMKLITLDSGHKFWSCTAKDKDGKNGYCNNSQDILDAKKPEQSEKLKENLALIKKLRIELGWKQQSLLDILPEWKGANLETESGTRVLIAYLNDVITEAANDELPFL